MFTSMTRRRSGGVPAMLTMLICSTAWLCAAPAAAQEALPRDEQDREREERSDTTSADPIQWNFRRVPVAAASSDIPLQERWAAPFAVLSAGSPAPRNPRPAVVLRDTAAARQVAQAEAGERRSEAEVSVEDTSESRGGGTAEASAMANDSGRSTRGTTTAAAPARRGSDAGGSRPEERTHRVAYGETWYGLAGRYRVSPAQLAAANPAVDPDRLRAGTVLRIPSAASSGPAGSRTHTVVRGDTLYGIALRYGVSPDALRSANRLRDDVVRLGQTLVIPREEAPDE